MEKERRDEVWGRDFFLGGQKAADTAHVTCSIAKIENSLKLL